MVHIISTAETVEEVVMVFVFLTKRLALLALPVFLSLVSCWLSSLLGLRWVASMFTLVLCHNGI